MKNRWSCTQVAGPAHGAEYPPRGWHAGQSQIRRTVGDLVMQPGKPALVIALRALAERRDHGPYLILTSAPPQVPHPPHGNTGTHPAG